MRSLRESLAGAPAGVLAAALAAIVIGSGLFGFAIAELTSDDSPEPAPPSAGGSGPAAVGGEGQSGGVPGWPQGLTSYTVVIGRSTNRAAAVGQARKARRAGLDAGLMAAARYGLGPKGLMLVFAGHFAARGGAQRYAKRLAARYPGARVELVQSSQ